MSEKTKGGCFCVMMVGIVATLIFCAGISLGMYTTRHDAIKAGAGEWQVDPKTGSTRFVFKEQQ